MNPEISRRYGEQHRAELHRQAERRRVPAPLRRPKPARLAMFRAVGRLRLWRRHARGAGAPHTAPLGVFLAGPDAFGFRTYLTADEARQLAADWVGLLDGFGDRAEDPSRRPDDAVLYEVVVLGRPVQDLVGAARGLPGA